MKHGRRTIPEGGPHRRTSETRRPQLGDERVLGVAATGGGTAVQDGRPARVQGQAQVASEVGELRLRRGVHAIEIQAGLPYRNDPRIGSESHDRRPIGLSGDGCVVGMDACGGVDPVVLGGEAGRGLGRARVPARNEKALDPGRARGDEHLRPVRIECGGLQVGVTVDEPHGRRPRLTGRLPGCRRGSLYIDAREERLGRSQAAGLPGVRPPAQLLEDGRSAVAVDRVGIRVAKLSECAGR